MVCLRKGLGLNTLELQFQQLQPHFEELLDQELPQDGLGTRVIKTHTQGPHKTHIALSVARLHQLPIQAPPQEDPLGMLRQLFQ